VPGSRYEQQLDGIKQAGASMQVGCESSAVSRLNARTHPKKKLYIVRTHRYVFGEIMEVHSSQMLLACNNSTMISEFQETKIYKDVMWAWCAACSSLFRQHVLASTQHPTLITRF